MPNSVKTEIDGKIIALARDGKEYHLNPRYFRESTSTSRRRPETTTTSKFKLVTVRQLTNLQASVVEEQLKEQQERLAAIALATGAAVPFPFKVPKAPEDLENSYAVYVDEDLYGRTNPVYTFTCPTRDIKAFITANEKGKQDYSVHIAHLVSKTKNVDDTTSVEWRILSIDNNLNGVGSTYSLLESQDAELPECFRHDFHIASLHYIGGGAWTAMNVDVKDRINVIAPVNKKDAEKYFPLDSRYKTGPTFNRRVPAVASYSITPSYVFTWCRGKLKVNRRVRSASHITNITTLKATGVVEATRTSAYSLDIPLRVENTSAQISALSKSEYCNSSATYVSNTNTPEVPGLEITPDYGTDVKRVAISQYNQESNVVRALSFTPTDNYIKQRAVRQFNCFNLIQASAVDNSFVLSYQAGGGKGSISHPYEIKNEYGKRGFQYGEAYNLWWCYGQIAAFNPTNDGMIYRRSKSAEARNAPSLFPTGETLYNRGELKLSKYSNATETTWPSLPNPQTGFFGIQSGDATWIMNYNNPPLFGHEATYYYHINPFLEGLDDTLVRVDNSLNDQLSALNTQRNLLAQIQGGLGGDTTSRLAIGRTRKAQAAFDTLPILSPSPSQQANLWDEPEKFPAGFWQDQIFIESVGDNNELSYLAYDREGNITKSDTTGKR